MNAQMNLAQCRVVMQLVVDTHYDPDTFLPQLRNMPPRMLAEFTLGAIILTGGYVRSCNPDADTIAFQPMDYPDAPEEVLRAYRNAAMAVAACSNDQDDDAVAIVKAATLASEVANLAVAVLSHLHGLEHKFGCRPDFARQ